MLDAGQAILLIDGVDEVPEGDRREAALKFIQDYARLYDKSLIIVASRPGACDRVLFKKLKFVEAQVDELSGEQRDSFIDNWHLAYDDAIPRTAHDPDPKAIATSLKRALENQPQIALLATNPLLCAGICALHERMPDSLPKSEWDLCEKLTAMLADQRDRRSGRQGSVDIDEFGPPYRVAYSIRRSVLARLADAMVTQQLSALPRSEALEHVKATLKGVRDAGELTSEDLLASLVARSGVLRAASIQPGLSGDSNANDERDAVEFVHNTLKAWLASLQSLEHNKPIALAKDALASEIGEVIVFAAAPTHRIYAEKLIKGLLTFASEQTDPGSRRAVEIIALRCDAAAPVLGPKLRDQLAQLADSLFPPAAFDEAQQLAVLGDAAVPRLDHSRVDDARAPAAIRCLRLIGSEPARRTLEGYRDATDPDALEELAQAFDPLILSVVLDATQHADRWLQLRPSIKSKIHSLSALAQHTNLRGLFLSGTNIADLSPLAGFHDLEEVNFTRTRVKDLSPLSELTHLKRIYLSETPIDNIVPLAKLKGLRAASLRGIKANLGPLANCTSLLGLIVGSDTIGDLGFLMTPLKMSVLAITQSKVKNLQSLSNLKSLSELYLWNSEVREVSALSNLPLLSLLSLRNLPIEGLGSLQDLTHLKELILEGLPAVDLEPLAALQDLQKLGITEMQVKTRAPLAGLSKLEFLDIRKTQVESLKPIMKLPSLRTLSAGDTPVSDDELNRFMAAVPGRTVNVLIERSRV